MRDLLTHFSATNNKKTNKQTIEYCQEAWKKLFVLHTDSCGWRCCVLDSLTLSPLCAIVKIHTHMPGGFSGEISSQDSSTRSLYWSARSACIVYYLITLWKMVWFSSIRHKWKFTKIVFGIDREKEHSFWTYDVQKYTLNCVQRSHWMQSWLSTIRIHINVVPNEQQKSLCHKMNN